MLLPWSPDIDAETIGAKWKTFASPLANIYYSGNDEIYANHADSVLRNAYIEISFDLRVQLDNPIAVFICPTRRIFREFTFGKLPKWTAGFADIHQQSMIVKSPTWDRVGTDFSGTLIHELSHLLLNKAVQYRQVPRWLDEGLAIFYSKEKQWASGTQISKALLTDSIIPLQDIDRVLTFHTEKAQLAYQESYTAVQYLLAVYDVDALHIFIQGIREGWAMDQIFQQATGSSFSTFENEWHNHIKRSYRWYFLVDINTYLWIFIIGLFVVGVIVIRLRNRRIVKKWEQEEEEAEQNQG